MDRVRSFGTDQDLRLAELRITDPYKQTGIVWEIPPGVELVEVINTYTFDRWPGEKARCIKCDGRRHKHGFTALLSNEAQALYGSKCGQDEFGESWAQATNRLRDRRKRQTLLFRLDELLPQIPNIRDGFAHAFSVYTDQPFEQVFLAPDKVVTFLRDESGRFRDIPLDVRIEIVR